MDISYLLWLQGIRESLPGSVETFFATLSDIAANEALVILVAIIYWCLSKELGHRLVIAFAAGTLVNNFVKLMVCAYRPWIRSSDIRPSVLALEKATGYSFPSGHTQVAGNLFGTAGQYSYRKSKKVLSVLLWVFVALIAFSRNFLGVHTPQDVLVGLTEAILTLFFVDWFMKWVEGGENRDLHALIATFAAIIITTIIVLVKPYPMDYDANGQLLVDPAIMSIDHFKSIGMVAGIAVGWFLERRTLNFETPAKKSLKRLAVRIVVGLVVLAALYFTARPLRLIGVHEGVYQAVKNFLVLLAAAYLSPLAFTKVEQLMGFLQ